MKVRPMSGFLFIEQERTGTLTHGDLVLEASEHHEARAKAQERQSWGIVRAAAPDVSGFAVGDRVLYPVHVWLRPGEEEEPLRQVAIHKFDREGMRLAAVPAHAVIAKEDADA